MYLIDALRDLVVEKGFDCPDLLIDNPEIASKYILNNIEPLLQPKSDENFLKIPFDDSLEICFLLTLQRDGDTCDKVYLPDETEKTTEEKEKFLTDIYCAAMNNFKFVKEEIKKEPVPERLENFAFIKLTNKDNALGAAAMLFTDELQKIMDDHNTELLYILPTSIHEVVAIVPNSNTSTYELRKILLENNFGEDADEDAYLSSTLYEYTKSNGYREVEAIID